MTRRLRPLPLLLLGLGCATAFTLLYVLAVRTAHGQRIDDAAVNGRIQSPVAHHAANSLLTTISVGSLALAVAALVGLALLRGRAALALAGGAVVAASLLTSELLKHVILTRPPLWSGVLSHNTFPSGHTTIAFSVGVAATLVAPPRWRRAVAATAFAFGSAIGIATVAAGWHRPSDVVGALLVVTGWAAGIVLLVALVDPRAFGSSPRTVLSEGRRTTTEQDGVSGAYVALALTLLALGWLTAIAIVAARHVGAIDLSRPNAAFIAACASIAAAAALLVAALMTVLREALPETRTHVRL